MAGGGSSGTRAVLRAEPAVLADAGGFFPRIAGANRHRDSLRSLSQGRETRFPRLSPSATRRPTETTRLAALAANLVARALSFVGKLLAVRARYAPGRLREPLGRRFRIWADYLKVEHTLFSLPLIYAGALLAEPPLTFRTAVLILVAATGARTTALGLNRILDRRLDARNPRTARRALPAGEITLRAAWCAAAGGFLVSLLAAWAISPRCLIISPIPLLAFFCYPLLKRVTRWAHAGLGLTLALGPLCGWYAVALEWRGLFPILALAAFTALWSAGFDILYATLDEESDKKTGVRSLPAAIGSAAALRVAAGLHAAAFCALLVLLRAFLEGPLPAFLFALAGVLFLIQHRARQRVEFAFFQVNAALGGVVLLGVAFSRTPPPG